MQGRCLFQAVMLIGLLAQAGCQSPKEALLEEEYNSPLTEPVLGASGLLWFFDVLI